MSNYRIFFFYAGTHIFGLALPHLKTIGTYKNGFIRDWDWEHETSQYLM